MPGRGDHGASLPAVPVGSDGADGSAGGEAAGTWSRAPRAPAVVGPGAPLGPVERAARAGPADLPPMPAGGPRGRPEPAVLAALHERYHHGREVAVRDRLVEVHTALAVGLAARFSERGETLDDLRQVALMALVKAVGSFDPGRNVQFSSYATVTILGELKRHFRDKRWGMRVPRTLQEQYLRTRDAVADLTQSLGRSPSVADVAVHLDTSEERVLEAMEVGRALRVGSLDAPADSDAPGSAVQVGAHDAGIEAVEDRDVLGPAVTRLPRREQHILRLRFVEGLSQAEIGRRVGLSQMQVSRLLSGSLDRLRGWLVERRPLPRPAIAGATSRGADDREERPAR